MLDYEYRLNQLDQGAIKSSYKRTVILGSRIRRLRIVFLLLFLYIRR